MMKFVLWICLLITLASLAACDSAATATALPPTETSLPRTPTPQQPTVAPTTPPPPATPSPPKATTAPTVTKETTEAATPAPTPTAAATPTMLAPTGTPRPESERLPLPPAEVPLLQSVEIPADHPAAPLAMLPADSLIYAQINIGTTSIRPELQEHVEFQLGHFVSGDELAIAEELLGTAGVRTLTVSIPYEGYEWACILQGDLLMIAIALAAGAESEAGLSASIVETHAGTDIYALVRTRSSGRQSEIYIAILESQTLAASPDLPALREVVERRQGALELPHALSGMIEDWGLGDFLQVRNTAYFELGATMQGTPLDKQRLFGFHATLSEDSTTVLRAVQQYDDEDQAAAAVAWLQGQAEPWWRNIGYGASVTFDQWRHRGATVYSEVTVRDGDVPDLVQGN